MRHSTLCYLVRGGKVLLGLKKRGFGVGKMDGIGGKQEDSEAIEETAVRELFEEIGIKVSLEALEKMGELAFEWPAKNEWNQLVHIFLVREWSGEPRESEEMKPEWHSIEELPFGKMWQCDTKFVPLVLQKKKLKGKFVFKEDNESVQDFVLEEAKEGFG